MNRRIPGLFEGGLNSASGDMGMLNYLVHTMAQKGQLKTTMSDLQHIPTHQGIMEFEQDCADSGSRFPIVIQRPRVAHFCGRKPFLFDRKGYSRPFTIARLEHYRHHHSEIGAWLAVLNEDGRVLSSKIKRRMWVLSQKHSPTS